MKKILVLFLLVILVFGCSTIQELTKKQKEEIVRANLAYLNKFKAEGLVEIVIKGFSLKKEFVFTKNQHSLRLDVIDSGIMSLFPSPFATLYAGEKILVTNYDMGFFPDLIIDKFPLKEFIDLEKLPQGIIDEIVKNKKFTIAIIQFEFDDLYRLSKIILNDNEISLKYIANDLVRAELKSSKADVNIDFDSFVSGDYSITPIEINSNKID